MTETKPTKIARYEQAMAKGLLIGSTIAYTFGISCVMYYSPGNFKEGLKLTNLQRTSL